MGGEHLGCLPPIEIFTSLYNARDNWLEFLFDTIELAWHCPPYQIILLSIAPPASWVMILLQFLVNIFGDFWIKCFSPTHASTAQLLSKSSDRVTEWTFIPTWQVLKWQIDQIFSSVTKTKIFSLTWSPKADTERATVSLFRFSYFKCQQVKEK